MEVASLVLDTAAALGVGYLLYSLFGLAHKVEDELERIAEALEDCGLELVGKHHG